MIPVFTPDLFMPTAAAYTGPGNVVASATAFWGLRAYTAASIGGNVVKIRRSSDSTTKVFVSIAGGGINVADAFFDGSNYFVDTLYDQTGNGHDASQAVTANQPEFHLAGLGSLPIITFVSANSTFLDIASITQAQPFTFSTAANNTATGSQVSLFGANDATFDIRLGFDTGGADRVFIYAGVSVPFVSSTHGSWYAFQAVYNSASSDININGTVNTVDLGTTNGLTTNSALGKLKRGTEFFNGKMGEFGFWPTNFSGTNSSNMSSNQRSYWGF